jgi:carbonic anhydrase/acetyltransferase-like protein (isoleucine patch superfamily)
VTVRRLGDSTPVIASSAWVSEAAYVIGAVEIGGDGCAVGDDVLVGHAAVVHCGRVGDRCLIGNHATLLDDADIGDYCTVAAGALVLTGAKIPDGSFVFGVPAVIRPASPEQIARLDMLSSPDVGYNALVKEYIAAGL